MRFVWVGLHRRAAAAGRISGPLCLTLPPCMQVSCDPRTGKLAVYPQHIQKILESNYAIFLHNGGPNYTKLGPGFFYITVRFFVDNKV